MKNIRMISLLLLILCSISNCSTVQEVHDQQHWYEEEKGDLFQNSEVKKDKQLDNSQVKDHDLLRLYAGNPKLNKILQIDREIIMTQEMIRLHVYRLNVLTQLKAQITLDLQQNIENVKNQEQIPKKQEQTKDFSEQTQKLSQNWSKHSKNSKLYVKLHEYEIDIQKRHRSQSQRLSQFQNSFSRKDIIVIPPFFINKVQSYVTIIDKVSQYSHQNRETSVNKGVFYNYGASSNRLLFYDLQDVRSSKKNSNQANIYSRPEFQFCLNIALEIKPNKIKTVKITYRQNNNKKKNTPEATDSHDQTRLEAPQFQVEEQVTQYDSHQLINQNFKWHHALEFQNLIIGFRNHTVFIKSKDKRMHEVNIGSKILEISSVNQYKVFFVAQKKVGTLNVRSLLVTEQISFEHFLGNRTLMRQRELKKQREHSNPQQDHDQAQLNLNQVVQEALNTFWHSPYTKKHGEIYSVASQNIESSKQVLILLSNGDLLIYQNDKISASFNLGNQLIKQFSINEAIKRAASNLPDVIEEMKQMFKVRLEITASNNHMMIHSNIHDKILIYNVTIPGLSYGQPDGFSWFLSAQKAKQLNSKYWLSIQIPLKHRANSNEDRIAHQFHTFNSLFLPISSQINKNLDQSQATKHQNRHLPTMLLFYCHYESQINHNDRKSKDDPEQGHQNYNSKPKNQLQRFFIQQYQLLLDLINPNPGLGLFQHNSQNNSGKAQGKSYFWNIFMIVIIICGVLLFRKCNSKNATPSSKPYEQQYPKDKANKNTDKSRNNNQSVSSKKKKTSLTKQYQEGQDQRRNNPNIDSYNESVIAEIQNHFQKQGQKLSKEQILQIINDMDPDQTNRDKVNKQKLQNETQKEEYFPTKKNNNRRNLAKDSQQMVQDQRKNDSQQKNKQKQGDKKKKQ